MQYLAAYTLASLSGKEPTEQDVTGILKATGKNVDAKQVTEVVNKLKGKPIHELISRGQSKVGGGSVGGGSAAGKTEAPKAAGKKQAEKPKGKPAPPPVEQPVEDEDFNLDLFG